MLGQESAEQAELDAAAASSTRVVLPGVLRLTTDCIVSISHWLRFADLAQLAHTCRALNKLVSMRLERALARHAPPSSAGGAPA